MLIRPILLGLWMTATVSGAGAAPAAPSDEEWTAVAREGEARYFINPKSLRLEKRYLRFDAKLELDKEIEREVPVKGGEGKRTVRAKDRLLRLAVSCEASTWAESSSSVRDAAGNVVAAVTKTPAEWEREFKEAPPGGAMARVIEAACKLKPAERAEKAEKGEKTEKSPERTPAKPGSIRTGAGVVIGEEGWVLTNQHVIDGCTNIGLSAPGQRPKPAKRHVEDRRNDLAVLKAEIKFVRVATFRAGEPLRSGENVVIAGFPLAGLLATETNVAFGQVSATSGVGNDSTSFQLSAPIHRGNSGGPVLDQTGRLVGVVSSKLNALKTAASVGDLAQNIGFGIKSEMVRLFLVTQGVEFDTSRASGALENVELATRAKEVTVQVICQ